MYTNADMMQFFQKDGFRLAFQEEGQGEPILLIHGFASSGKINWVSSGWFKTLIDAGYRAIAIDNLGHGHSDKSYDPAVYTAEHMAADATALLQHLKIKRAHVMGYSMGAKIAAVMIMEKPQTIQTAIFGGLGINLVTGSDDWKSVANALIADDAKTIENERGLMFRKFADRTRSDRKALAACITMMSKKKLTIAEIQRITSPVLVAIGSRDKIAGEPQSLAALLPKGEVLVIPNRDHMLAVGDKIYKNGVLDFLNRHKISRA